MANRIKQANEANAKLKELERKSMEDDEEIQFLREEIDKERRKSTADENTIKKLEYLLAEKLKVLDGEKSRNSALENEMRSMR